MKNNSYNEFLTKEYMMGPNSLRLLEEMLSCIPENFAGGRLLDLGCGRAVTSLYLARETAAESVYAADLWISASENYASIRKWGQEKKIIPLHSDASDLPFADEYFDAIVSVDAYHYFGCGEGFFAEKILPLLAPGGYALIAVPGVTNESAVELPLMRKWAGEDAKRFHSCQWWQEHISKNMQNVDINVLQSRQFDAIWEDWFSSGHEYAAQDKDFLDRGMREKLCFVIIIVRKIK